MTKVIAFYVSEFSLGSYNVTIYNYAKYNIELLKNKSVIFYRKDPIILNESMYKKFQNNFTMIEYTTLDDLINLVSSYKVDIFYNLKTGENDGFLVPNVKNVCHCITIYGKNHAHGDIYIPSSPVLVDSILREVTPILPYIVSLPKMDINLREYLNIPKDSLVFGRHGRYETFDIPFVQKVVQEVANEREDIYFLFLNTVMFCCPRKNIIFINGLTEEVDKSYFINTCDAMLHAKTNGEKIGLSVMEFFDFQKQVITYKLSKYTHHIDILGDKGLYYSNEEELKEILLNFKVKEVNFSNPYSPEVVMDLFNKYVIENDVSRYNFIQSKSIDGKSYLYYDELEVNKNTIKTINLLIRDISKINPPINYFPVDKDIFVDIGSNIGLFVASNPNAKVVSMEEDKDNFTLLKQNIKNNNLNNVDCFNENFDIDFLSQFYTDIRVILINNNEVNTIKNGVILLSHQRPYIVTFNSNISSLLKVLKYSSIEITNGGFLFYPREKEEEVKSIFNSFINNDKIEYTEKLTRIKLMCSWTSSEELCRCWSKMSKGNCRWNNIQVTHEDNDIDYYVIINKPQNNNYNPEKTIVFRMEPDTETASVWNDWYQSKEDFMYFLDLSKYRNNSEWHLNLSYNEMNNSIKKTKTLSTVVSSLYNSDGHRKRIDFIKYLQQNNVEIDVYGRDNNFNFSNYKGGLPYHNKNDGILPYKYNFIAENCSMNNYFTEKLLDSILGESVCFYWGCPNVERFIDGNSFIRLNLNNFEESLNIVTEAIKNDEWSKRINTIRREKKKIIEHYSFFPRVEGFILLSELDCKVINKTPKNRFDSEARRVGFKNYVSFSIGKGVISMDFKNISGRQEYLSNHYSIWRSCEKNILVLEDDIKLIDNFTDNLAMVYRYIVDIKLDFDILFIGEETIGYETEGDLIVSANEVLYRNDGCLFPYIVSVDGAKKMMSLVKGEVSIDTLKMYMVSGLSLVL